MYWNREAGSGPVYIQCRLVSVAELCRHECEAYTVDDLREAFCKSWTQDQTWTEWTVVRIAAWSGRRVRVL